MQTQLQLQTTAEPAEEQKSEDNDEKSSEADIVANKESESDEYEFKDIWHQSNPFYEKLFGLKFPYLQDLHVRYGNSRESYTEIAKEIYSEFIHEDAVHVCNIGWQTRGNITKFIQEIDNMDPETDINSPVEIEKYLLLLSYQTN